MKVMITTKNNTDGYMKEDKFSFSNARLFICLFFPSIHALTLILVNWSWHRCPKFCLPFVVYLLPQNFFVSTNRLITKGRNNIPKIQSHTPNYITLYMTKTLWFCFYSSPQRHISICSLTGEANKIIVWKKSKQFRIKIKLYKW